MTKRYTVQLRGNVEAGFRDAINQQDSLSTWLRAAVREWHRRFAHTEDSVENTMCRCVLYDDDEDVIQWLELLPRGGTSEVLRLASAYRIGQLSRIDSKELAEAVVREMKEQGMVFSGQENPVEVVEADERITAALSQFDR